MDVSGYAQGVVTFSEAAAGGQAPANANLQLIDVLAAQEAPPLYLASLTSTPSLQSPVHLTSYVSRVVTQ